LAMILATTAFPVLAATFDSWNGALISAAGFFLLAAFAGAALPSVDGIPADFPAGVLGKFRLTSIGPRAIFWCALGVSFGAMAEKWLKRRSKQGVTLAR